MFYWLKYGVFCTRRREDEVDRWHSLPDEKGYKGSALSWFANERPRQHLDRINLSYQREIFGTVVDATYFLNTANVSPVLTWGSGNYLSFPWPDCHRRSTD